MVHLYATSSRIWLDGQSPFWPTGLNMGPQSRNTRSGLQTNYGRPRLYYCKIWTQTQFMQCQHICQQNTRKCIQTFTHMNTQWERPAQGIGGRVHTQIYRTLHALSLYLCQLRAGGQISQRDTTADWMGARQSLSQCMEGLYWFCSVHIAGMIIIGLNGLLFK